jgi:hypothetical protein
MGPRRCSRRVPDVIGQSRESVRLYIGVSGRAKAPPPGAGCGRIVFVGLVWVTGISGAGKSSVCEHLTRAGHRAVDADAEGFTHWAHRHTGTVIVDPPYPVPPRWLDDFAWKIDLRRVEALASASGSGVTFLCGGAENESEVWQHFDVVVCLIIDDETLRHRLATRTNNAFGKHAEELAAALAWNGSQTRRYRERGASLVDATRPLAEVAHEVLVAALPAVGREQERVTPDP